MTINLKSTPTSSAIRDFSTVFVCGLTLAALAFPAASQASYKQLYAFQGAPSDGAAPQEALLKYNGDFYGVTATGGSGSCSYSGFPGGCGTIFKLTAKGTETPLYSFTGGSDGGLVDGPLVVDKAGNLYTALVEGGGGSNCTAGCGTVVKYAPDGNLTVLYTFQGGSDGAWPDAGLIIDKKGNLYGTTYAGGSGDCKFAGLPPGCGTVFKISPEGKETLLHTFQGTGDADGAAPVQVLLRDAQGNLYGTSQAGGSGAQCRTTGGCGTVFKLAADGTETVLYSFCSRTNCNDGEQPIDAGPLVADEAGDLYGTTYFGGSATSELGGTAFELAADGAETVLYAFCSQQNCSDGEQPQSGLIVDTAGNLYGTTTIGGTGQNGVVFRLTPSGTESVLHAFTGGSDGGLPSGLMQDGSTLFGAAQTGGGNANCTGGCGTIFKVKE